MKIIGMTPNNKKTGETPEQMYLRKLGELGHKVIITDKASQIKENFDVVVSLSELTSEEAFKLATVNNKPFYSHIEWLPVWRIFKEDERNWGHVFQLPWEKKMTFVRMYLHYSLCWASADVKSLAANCFHKTMKDFLGNNIKIESKRLGVNTDKIFKYLEENKRPKKTEITCIARFVPHKRLHHVIAALKLINFTGTLNFVGYGLYDSLYNEMTKTIKFEIKYLDSSEKLAALDRSIFSVALWSGMVPAESMYMGAPCVTYHSDYMWELFNDTVIYAKNNDIKDLSEKFKLLLSAPEEEKKKICGWGIKRIENGEINTITLEKSVKMLEGFIKNAKKIHERRNNKKTR